LKPHVHAHPSERHGDFDSWAPSYDKSLLQRVFFDRTHARVVRALRPLLRGAAAPVVVDVGCGTGRLLSRLRSAFPSASLIGVDAAAGMIEVASRKPELAGVHLVVASADALPFEDASCDVVVSTISFHHWSDQAAGLRDVARVLRPGGNLVLVDFMTRGALAPLMRRFGVGHGVGMRTDGELIGLLHGASLRAAEQVRVGPPGSPLGIMVATRP
jgi:ubiquinone/menaquinone biosynthesis C-methylase UbiE